jgi:hypothetical protein
VPLRHLILALAVSSPLLIRQGTSPRPAAAADPVTAILQAFNVQPVVALGEGDHGNEQGHAFRLALLGDARFAATINDIVVEFGNALYQDVIDRFVNGADVPDNELRRVWQDTTQLQPVWDPPIYEELFRAVRRVNASRPVDRRLRVLLGDPPIDWKQVARFADISSQMRAVGDRDTYPAKLIEREVLGKGRRALVIYGDQHLKRTPAALRPGCQVGSTAPCFPGSIVDQLESLSGARAFTITAATGTDLTTMQPDVANWPIPSLAVLRGTVLGATSYRSFLPPGPLMIGPDGQPQPEPPAVLRPIQDVFDAVLYLGPRSTITYSRVSPALCADVAYVRMRRERMAMAPGGPGSDVCVPSR